MKGRLRGFSLDPLRRVFATRRFPEHVREELERSFELDVNDSEWPPSRDELLARVAVGGEGLLGVEGSGEGLPVHAVARVEHEHDAERLLRGLARRNE